MPIVVSCKFRSSYRVYYFSPGDTQELCAGEQVIVETARGRELAQVVNPRLEIGDNEIVSELKPVIRRANPADLLDAQTYQRKEKEAVERCKEQVAKANLPMKIVGSEYNFDGSNLTIYFTSEQRVDFRDLVRDLARIFRTRIELRQVGVRDEAKEIGGVGRCGRPLCCATWLPEFYPVSIRMAKLQDLPLSPMEISGCCGRLLCCLSYENEQYAEVKSHFPKVGKIIQLSCGPARITRVDALREVATVLLEDGTIRLLTAEQITGESPLECEADEEPLDEQHDSLDGVLATLGEKARESLGSVGGYSEETAPSSGTTAVEAAPYREARGNNSSRPDRRSQQSVETQNQYHQQAAESQIKHRQEQPQTRDEAVAGSQTNETARKKRRHRGGRHHARRDKPMQAESSPAKSSPQPGKAD
ncbi:MAG: stage 0 sporulation family protein [Chloroflexi bacterium]|nr:stage 0 sporulation family protein [Chloroflexota bacterium]